MLYLLADPQCKGNPQASDAVEEVETTKEDAIATERRNKMLAAKARQKAILDKFK
ncbi:hypothetical protein SARC_17653, partial [Sphaeroforma arctica JP610]